MRLEVVERCRYTTIFHLHQQHAEARWLGRLRVEVRAYHDAGMLEVGMFQSHRQVAARYQYPNEQMFQQDEKVPAKSLSGGLVGALSAKWPYQPDIACPGA